MSDEAIKHDDNKPPMDLLPPEFLVETARVFGYGADKYERHNWLKGMRWGRVYAALQRHLVAWQSGEDTDEESGLPHLAHASCCLAFLLTYQARGLGEDDRVKIK